MSLQPPSERSQQSDANAGYHHHHHHHRHDAALRTSPLDQQHQRLAQPDELASTTAPPHAHATARLAAFSANILGTGGDVTHKIREGPPAKRRKLSIRGKQSLASHPDKPPKPLQSTLDRFAFAQVSAPKLAVAQSRGQLHASTNGVHPTPNLRDDAPPKSPAVNRPGLATGNATAARPLVEASARPQKPKPKTEDKRSLRSHDEGPRLKSELATYFPNYEEIIFDTVKEVELIGFDTALYVTDDVTKQQKSDIVSPSKRPIPKPSPTISRRTSVNGNAFPTTPQRSNSNQFNGSPILNLDFASKTLPEKPEDPLADEHFFKSHRRAERKEKQLRNIERERAMHEKVQLERLLDALQGYDWLRVLGITGITDTEARKFEPKRDFFISEVRALVDKFKQWREQEKKQRLEKEAAIAAREDDEDESLEGSVDPPSSDLNASAARQLQQETFNALKSSKSSHKGKERVNQASPLTQTAHAPPSAQRTLPPPGPPSPEIPITSFYDKPHLRDAALGKSRHGRNVTAFGHPVPDMNEAYFKLPSEYVTEDALRANARERRRRKRDAITNTKKQNSHKSV